MTSTSGQSLSAAEGRLSDAAAVQDVEDAYDEAWSEGDLDRLMSFLAEDALIVSPRGDIARGHEQIRHLLGGVLEHEMSETTHESSLIRIEFASEDVAVVDGTARISGSTDPQHEPTYDFQHGFTDILVRRDGTWRISHIRAYPLVDE